jgi:hypothetical protein
MDAAMDLASEVDSVDPSELEALRVSLPNLTSNTPQSSVAVTKWKKFITKAGSTIGPMIKKLIAEIATAEIKRQMGL